ncbi:pentatricopeptide repeat-containing protein At2g36730-like, partial [Miscanthus floridulus]|uniref:pentatricopeptide repeat-containing protein At2g36730-like n=1 Tax=Miscanthus floridulus TaxID=154761 RepID=UPI003458E969
MGNEKSLFGLDLAEQQSVRDGAAEDPARPQVPPPPAADPRPAPRPRPSASPRLLPALVSAAFSVASSSPRHAAAAAILRAAGAGASTVAHNTLIERLAGRGGGRDCSMVDAFAVYAAMRAAGVSPNGFTFTFLLRACECLRRLPLCRSVHGQIVRCGFGSDVVVQNALLNVYYKCSDPGDVGVARKVFDEMADRDVVSWNSIG